MLIKGRVFLFIYWIGRSRTCINNLFKILKKEKWKKELVLITKEKV